MYFIAILCLILCAPALMAMEQENRSLDILQRFQQESQAVNVKFFWTMLVGATKSNARSPIAWFETPALEKMMASKDFDADQIAIAQDLCQCLDQARNKNITFFYQVQRVCAHPDAAVLCPELKKSFDQFKDNKEGSTARDAVTLLTTIVNQGMQLNFSSTQANAKAKKVLAEHKEKAMQLKDKASQLDAEQVRYDLEVKSLVPDLDVHLNSIEKLEAKDAWDLSDYYQMCLVEDQLEQMEQVAGVDAAAMILMREADSMKTQMDQNVATLKRLEKAGQVMAIGCLIGAFVYRLWSMWSEKQQEKEQHYQYGYMRAQ